MSEAQTGPRSDTHPPRRPSDMQDAATATHEAHTHTHTHTHTTEGSTQPRDYTDGTLHHTPARVGRGV